MSNITIARETMISDMNFRKDGQGREKELETVQWQEGTIVFRTSCLIKSYRVLFAPAKDGTYSKPVERYNSREFEELFGFGGMCQGYNPEKVILIRGEFLTESC